ncbi:DUF6752 domain-containing protein [Nocardioides lianchengensis]|uniref:DUF6752 domain-containing protein n=1 Tax=Nocardioides lianchengensis TaxID=1045774 RepID=A0A1G6TLG2_9ACTN|nr:DUF6752 domain-containing protein [Nocardioides lianchengensis]NYG11715.1 uncharacterized protein YigA (DUF484 family) [Nocardioides lianchengensis]SDD29913.1 hypothetical protein SAMN05421872_107119 [Nocardioides lianchengensis]
MSVLQSRFRIVRDRWERRNPRSSSIRARLAALEEEAQENRQLNRRIAELTDVVTELLIPLSERDEERVAEVLKAYRAGQI